MYDTTLTRPQKDQCRSAAIKHFNKSAKVALYLPSVHALDIKQSFREDKINSNTKLICIENDHKIAKKHIFPYLNTFFNDFHIFNHNAHQCDLNPAVETYGKIDTAFFDFCGSLSNNLVRWIEHYNDCLKVGSKLAFTFSVGHMGDCLTLKARDNTSFLNWLYNKKIKNSDSLEYRSSLPTIHLLMRALKYSCRLDFFKEYRDSSTPMLFLLLTKVKECDKLYSVFHTKEFSMPVNKLSRRKATGLTKTRPTSTTTETVGNLVQRFKEAGKSVPKLAGAKRAATVYVQKRVAETGKPARLYTAAIRAQLSANGMQNKW